MLTFKGDIGDLTSDSLLLSDMLLRAELGLEESDITPDLGVSDLEEGLEELLFLGEEMS